MGIDAAELKIARRNTRAFINADPISVIIHRPVLVDNESGGKVRAEPMDLGEQTFRLVPTSTRAGDQSYRTPDGSFSETREELVGMPDADLEKGDFFTYDGKVYIVGHVSPETSYRTSGWVTQRGDGNAVIL